MPDTDEPDVDRWRLFDPDTGNVRAFDSRAEAEDTKEDLEGLGVNAVVVPPGETPGGEDAETDGGATQPEVVEADAEPIVDDGDDLPERTVSTDPIQWMPSHFIDVIEGEPAVNRKGFEVLSHFYNISTESNLEVPPEDTDHTYCRVKAVSVTEDGRTCEAYGSSHVDRGDDPTLLLELADTRARKRSLSIATGVGAVSVAEMQSEGVRQ